MITGQEFDRPFRNLRGCWLMEKARGLPFLGGVGGIGCTWYFPFHKRFKTRGAAWLHALQIAATPPHTHTNANKHVFSRNPPPQVVLAFARRVVSCMELGDVTKNPYMVFPLLALAHVVNVSPPGQARPPGGHQKWAWECPCGVFLG